MFVYDLFQVLCYGNHIRNPRLLSNPRLLIRPILTATQDNNFMSMAQIWVQMQWILYFIQQFRLVALAPLPLPLLWIVILNMSVQSGHPRLCLFHSVFF